MKPFYKDIRKVLAEGAADQLLDIVDKLNLGDIVAEERLAFASAVLMLGEPYPSAFVALGVIKSIEETDLFTALVLLGQSLSLLENKDDIGEAVSTVISRGFRQVSQRLMIKANTL